MNGEKITVDKSPGIHVGFHGKKWGLGYEVVGLDQKERIGGGIVDLDPEKQLRAPSIRERPDPNQPGKRSRRHLVSDRQADLDVLWQKMVQIANLNRVAGRPKVHEACVRFCDEHGLPTQSRLLGQSIDGRMLVADFVTECDAVARAILESEGRAVTAPNSIIRAFKGSETFSLVGTGGDLHLEISDVFLAAWFPLIRWGVSRLGVCAFCGGPNVGRLNSKFCSSYCRDRWHKRQSRGRRS